MKSLIISQSDNSGGAARAAYRLHRALLQSCIESHMLVRIKKTDDWTVNGPASKVAKALGMLRMPMGLQFNRLQNSANGNLHSGNWLSSHWSSRLNTCHADVVNLHWVAGETMSIEDIGRIQKPIVWTLHDMWAFCGAEHVTSDDKHARWRAGYDRNNRTLGDSGIDLNRIVWQRKRKAWKHPMHIVTPSTWLADCVRNSVLLRDWPVSVIPNVLDTECYQPLNQAFCRQVLRLPNDKKVVLFGAMGGGNDPNKGYDLLLEALQRLAIQINPEGIACVVFGQSEPEQPPSLPFPTYWMGHIHDDTTLALLYNAADVMVVPSRQENLPQTATEPQACGCPVVAFDCTGLRDAIEHQQTGFLAQAYDPADMANGIAWLLQNKEHRQRLGMAARQRAIQLWSPKVVVPQYINLYRQAIESYKDSR
ncbi:glycosyltransferase family 4 protein [Pseudogulbenkiania subflava]|uniref:Glycosyltransferase involved in cell wall bisynthesis n=1 Tax=Pseudogulbenkiania subflava DSM 22618 TaxID=1123014 RepID=A0A1Y6B9Y9_9NEIS|nr:glycosyltransferase family 4 protein [Pseudogulbenkiania subflava]SMF00601.1 Glycosyltransferase involved in cell wall bisynthesis [Pseudogulbenkiania subflava DSM 22618]